MAQDGEKFKPLSVRVPSELEEDPLLVSARMLYISVLFSIWCHIFHIFVLFVGDFTVQSSPQAWFGSVH